MPGCEKTMRHPVNLSICNWRGGKKKRKKNPPATLHFQESTVLQIMLFSPFTHRIEKKITTPWKSKWKARAEMFKWTGDTINITLLDMKNYFNWMLGHSLKPKQHLLKPTHLFFKEHEAVFYFNKFEVKSFFFVIHIFFFHKAFKNIEPRRKPVSMKGSVVPASRKCSHSRTCVWWLLHSSFKNIHFKVHHVQGSGKERNFRREG